MSFHTLLDDLYIDLPDWYSITYNFKAKTSCMAISYHGGILGVGLVNGQTQLVDSFSGCGNIEIFKHKSAVIDISFSRDGLFVAHCDNKNITIHNIETRETIFSQDFEDKIIGLQFSKKNPTIIYYLTQSQVSLNQLNLAEKTGRQFPGQYNVFNILPNDNIIVAKNTKISLIDTQNGTIIKSFDAPARKSIHSIEVSHKGDLAIIIDKAGAAHLLNLGTGEFLHKFCDHVGDTRFSTASFDRHDEHIIFGTAEITDASFTAYELDRFSLRKSFTNGPREAILQLIFHPVHPIVYARASKGIHVWRAVYKNRWVHSVPELDNMFANEMYQEPENEFDQDFESGARKVEDLSDQPVDIFSKAPFYVFEDDKNYEKQIFTIPITINDIKNCGSDDEEEDFDEEDEEED